MLTPPQLPALARIGNRLSFAARLGLPVVPLDEQRLIDDAARTAGTSDFGSDTFRVGLYTSTHA